MKAKNITLWPNLWLIWWGVCLFMWNPITCLEGSGSICAQISPLNMQLARCSREQSLCWGCFHEVSVLWTPKRGPNWTQPEPQICLDLNAHAACQKSCAMLSLYVYIFFHSGKKHCIGLDYNILFALIDVVWIVFRVKTCLAHIFVIKISVSSPMYGCVLDI